jgi:hypothetical protein
MKRRMTLWVQLAFLVIFVAVAAALVFVRGPEPTLRSSAAVTRADARVTCEAKGDWWDEEDQLCAVPMPVSTITHRR